MSRPVHRPTAPFRLSRLVRRALVVLAFVAAGSASAQLEPGMLTPSSVAGSAVERSARAAFAGSDLVGKDGPMARVGYELALLHAAFTGAATTSGDLAAVMPGTRIRDDHVLIDAIAARDADALLRDLERLGLRDGAKFGAVVSGFLPIASLDEAAALGSLRGARPSRAARRVGDVTSQAVQAMNVDLARGLFGLDGSGVAVGTLSDSYGCLTSAPTAADDAASGDVPIDVTVLAELGGCSGAIDEGRAMIQLIHDLAPGANQLFHSAFNGYADFAQGILDLADAGADVIVDDIIYFAEPMFQDGIVALAADQVVEDGIPYFSSAGNQADLSYESAFRPTDATVAGVAGTFHDFDPGPGTDVLQRITVPPGRSITVILQWDDPSAETGGAGPDADLDLYLVDATGTALIGSGTTDNIADGVPVEGVTATNSGSTTATANLAIELWGVAPEGAAPTIVKYVDYGDLIVDEYATDSPTSYGHANAAGARSVAAASYEATPRFGQAPPLPEPFTSLSGVPILFDVDGVRLPTPDLRAKPDITGVDGTDTTFFGVDSDGTGFPNFFGTSAAAPHVAAVAALLLELDPTLAPQDVYRTLQSTAIDMESPGFDALTGHGLVQADASIAALPGVTLAKGAFSPDGDASAAPGEAVAVLQLEARSRSGFPAATLDALAVEVASVGVQAGEVERVLLYEDADGDGRVDGDAVPAASATLDEEGRAMLAPAGGAPIVAGDATTLLLVMEFGDAVAAVPAAGWTWALALPLLVGASRLRRRRGWLAIPLLALLLTACPAATPPEPDAARFTLRVTDASASYVGAAANATVVGLPIDGRSVELVGPTD